MYDVLSVQNSKYYTNITVDVLYNTRLPDKDLLPPEPEKKTNKKT